MKYNFDLRTPYLTTGAGGPLSWGTTWLPPVCCSTWMFYHSPPAADTPPGGPAAPGAPHTAGREGGRTCCRLSARAEPRSTEHTLNVKQINLTSYTQYYFDLPRWELCLGPFISGSSCSMTWSDNINQCYRVPPRLTVTNLAQYPWQPQHTCPQCFPCDQQSSPGPQSTLLLYL